MAVTMSEGSIALESLLVPREWELFVGKMLLKGSLEFRRDSELISYSK